MATADDIRFPNEAIDESYGIDALIGTAGAIALEALGGALETKSASLITNSKIESQMLSRGWDQSLLQQTIDSPYATRAAVSRLTGNNATAYFSKDASYAIIDDVINEVVQISNRNNLNWIPDSSIENPYKP